MIGLLRGSLPETRGRTSCPTLVQRRCRAPGPRMDDVFLVDRVPRCHTVPAAWSRARGPAGEGGRHPIEPSPGCLVLGSYRQASFFSFSNERSGGSLFRMTPSV